MAPSIIETVLRNKDVASKPMGFHSSEQHRRYSAPSSTGTFQLTKYSTIHAVKAATRDMIIFGTPVPSLQHPSQALSSADARRGSDDFDATVSSPQVNISSESINRHVTPTTSNDLTKLVTSSPVEQISASASTSASTSASASASAPASGAFDLTERALAPAGGQSDDDDPAYSIGHMKIFHKMQRAIPPPYESRWEIIFPDIFDRVLSRLRRRRFAVKLNKPIVLPNIQLMSAGTTKDTSVPAVVVMVPKNIKMMQDFLNTDSTVQNLCKPRDGTTVELQVVACKDRSTLIGKPGENLEATLLSLSDSDSDCLSDDDDSITSADDSDIITVVHFKPPGRGPELNAQIASVVFENYSPFTREKYAISIRLVAEGSSRYVRGTCGGFLQLESPGRPPRQVGFMAGHLLGQLRQHPKTVTQEPSKSLYTIGDIIHPRNPAEMPRHDWALFDASKLKLENAMASQKSLTIAQKSELPGVDTVVSIQTSRGEVTGTLSCSTSGILLNPDEGFVHVKMITVGKDSTITKGDSGAWVVHKGLGKILGHIIATNSNGHTYMVPMHLVIDEMKTIMSVADVSLATATDLGYDHRVAMVHDQDKKTEKSIPISEQALQSSLFAIVFEVRKLQELAESYLGEEQVASAIALLEKAVFIQRQLPEADQSRLATKHKLGRAYSRNGQFLRAIGIFEELTKIRGMFLDQHHPDRLESQHELAFAYTQNGQAPEAIEILKNVLEIEVQIVNKAHVGHLTSQHELARAYLADGHAKEAIMLLEHIVAVRTETLRESDLHLLESQIVLAEALLSAGRTADSVNQLEHVVAVADATFGQHHKIRVDSRRWLDFARRQFGPSYYRRAFVQASAFRSSLPQPRTAAPPTPPGSSESSHGPVQVGDKAK